MVRRFLGAVAMAVLALGCSHAKQLPPNTVDVGGGVTETVNGDETKKAFDLNGDGKPDAFEIYKNVKDEAGKPVMHVVRKEFDLNGDGKIDMIRSYDEKEQLQKESNDLDFDGKPDVVTYYEKGQRVKEERDFDAQGVAHTWVYYEKNRIARKREGHPQPRQARLLGVLGERRARPHCVRQERRRPGGLLGEKPGHAGQVDRAFPAATQTRRALGTVTVTGEG